MKKIAIFSFLLLVFSLSGSVVLLNDSIYPLKAIIYNAQGEKIDEIVLDVNEQYNWYDNQKPFVPNPTATETPFTVRFICYNNPLKEEREEAKHQELKGEYSNDTMVAQSAMVTADTSPNGPKTCQVVDKKKNDST